MAEDSKNKLAGMIAQKQKAAAKTPSKPAAAASSAPKQPSKPNSMDKLMAAKKGITVQKGQAAPAKPTAAQKMDAARTGVKKVAGSPSVASARPQVASSSRQQAPARPATPKPAPPKRPRKPSEPGMFTRMMANLKVHIHEEIQEIKKELSVKHLLKPIVNSFSSMRKGASYLKERLSEDTTSVKDAYREVGEDLSKLKAYDRSNPEGNIARVEDERRQARQYGAAFEQMGAIRGRSTHSGGHPHAGASSVEAGTSDEVAMATPGAQPVSSVPPPPDFPAEAQSGTSVPPPPDFPTDAQPGTSVPLPPAGFSSDARPVSSVPLPDFPTDTQPGTSVPLPPAGFSSDAQMAASAVELQARKIGDALAQMGSIRQREAASKWDKTHDAQQETVTPESSTPVQEAGDTAPQRPSSASGSETGTSPSSREQAPPLQPQEPVGRSLEIAPEPASSASAQPLEAVRGNLPGVEPSSAQPPQPSQPSQSPEVARGDLPGVDPASTPQRFSLPATRTVKKKAGVQRKVSKTEIQVRTIRALQVLFGHSVWKMAIVDQTFKVSQFYLPRKTFEENFAEAGFRNALKAASRVAIPFGGEWREALFDERTVEEVLKFEFPKVKGNDDPDEKQIAAKCEKEMIKRIEGFVESDEVKRLIRNTGARLSLFVPTVEIIARIYLALKKGNDVDPKSRMDIQKDVMFKYQKAKYPEKSARKARNVALRFFFEHLVDYGLEIYKERKAAALEMKTTAEVDMESRFESLKEVACNLASERATKAALSAQVITELREHIRGAISDFEQGIEPGSGTDSNLDAEEEEDTEETPSGGPAKPSEGAEKAPSQEVETGAGTG